MQNAEIRADCSCDLVLLSVTFVSLAVGQRSGNILDRSGRACWAGRTRAHWIALARDSLAARWARMRYSLIGPAAQRKSCGHGRLAQRESASFTPRRSLVRSQYRPQPGSGVTPAQKLVG